MTTRDEVKERREAWERQYPNYCRCCGGHGAFYSTYDPSPAGVSLGPGYMTDSDPCTDYHQLTLPPRRPRLRRHRAARPGPRVMQHEAHFVASFVFHQARHVHEMPRRRLVKSEAEQRHDRITHQVRLAERLYRVTASPAVLGAQPPRA